MNDKDRREYRRIKHVVARAAAIEKRRQTRALDSLMQRFFDEIETYPRELLASGYASFVRKMVKLGRLS